MPQFSKSKNLRKLPQGRCNTNRFGIVVVMEFQALPNKYVIFSLLCPFFLDILRKICAIMFMDFELFRREMRSEIFDYQILAKYLSDLKKPRDKISALIAEGKLIRVKNGLYVFGENWRRSPLCLEMIANLLYGPSCISLEYALNKYGLIAERSTVITSLTLGDTKTFHTQIGTFEYQAISKEKFKVGIEYKSLGKEGGYFIASKEKALADLVYRTPHIRTARQLRYYLFEEMRVDETMFYNFDRQKLHEIATAYNKTSINILSNL